MFPEGSLAPLNGRPAESRGNDDLHGGFRNGLAPVSALIDPRPQQRNLFLRKRLAFSLGRHLHVLDQASRVMDHRALASVSGDNVDAMFPTLQGGFAVIKAELALRPLRAVTLQTRPLEQRPNLPIEIHR